MSKFKTYSYIRKQLQTKKTFNLRGDLQPILDTLENIRSKIDHTKIDIPGVVVTGAQSSGKSSLLENLACIRLPTGQNITTRVPLILRLEYKADTDKQTAYISKTPNLSEGEYIDDIKDIPNKIEEYTKDLAGDSGCVVDTPIHLKVIQSSTPSVTLIDLPGITHMSVNNIQDDIHTQTTALVNKYISNERMIIICVVPAQDDFANSEAIKISKKIDTGGTRTLGVITKVDACYENICDKITGSGNNIHLKHGFVAVKNKVDIKKSFKDTVRSEKEFFSTNSYYKDLDKKYWGLDTLVSKIIDLQRKSIEECLPAVQQQLQTEIDLVTSEVNGYKKTLETKHQQINFILKNYFNVMEQFNTDYADGTVMNKYFKEYQKNMTIPKSFLDDNIHDKIYEIVQTTSGMNLSNFLPLSVFKTFYQENRKHFRDQTNKLIEKCVSNIKDHLKKTVRENKGLKCVSKLVPLMETVSMQFIDKNVAKMSSIIDLILECEHEIFTQHKDYTNEIQDIRSIAFNKEPYQKYKDTFMNIKGIPSEFLDKYSECESNENSQTACEIQVSLYSYTNIVINRLCDMIPMLINKHLVDNTKASLMNDTIEYLENSELDQYFKEDKSVIEYQNKRKAYLEDLNECNRKLRNIVGN